MTSDMTLNMTIAFLIEGAPNTTFLEPRKWRLDAERRKAVASNEFEMDKFEPRRRTGILAW